MWSDLARWVNRERAAFSVAAVWLLWMGLRYQSAPVLAEWGPQHTDVPPPEERFVNLGPPPPISEFLAGDRGNPFSDVERRVAFEPQPLPKYRRPEPPKPRRPRPTRPKTSRRTPPPPPPTPPPSRTDQKPVEKPKPYDLPVRVVGRIEVERVARGSSGGRIVFAVKEDDRYIAVREGEELPGLGVKLVRATKSVVIVENEEGRRFRLTDLLRSKADEGEGDENSQEGEGE
jgi:uncharacterized protein YjhX (UPF0386 family)